MLYRGQAGATKNPQIGGRFRGGVRWCTVAQSARQKRFSTPIDPPYRDIVDGLKPLAAIENKAVIEAALRLAEGVRDAAPEAWELLFRTGATADDSLAALAKKWFDPASGPGPGAKRHEIEVREGRPKVGRKKA